LLNRVKKFKRQDSLRYNLLFDNKMNLAFRLASGLYKKEE